MKSLAEKLKVTAPKQTIKKIQSGLSGALRMDRLAASREIRRIKRAGKYDERAAERLLRLEKRIERSAEERKARVVNRPRLSFMENLPITKKKEEIVDAIRKHRVVIISGETGSGKTTQIPKFCLAAGRGIDGVIGCTQPRRIAAVSVAGRIAEELGEPLGESVGCKIRFKETMGGRAYIKIMTDGVLLAETQSDPYLNAYDVIIVDEAHERSLNIDFVLGILKNLLHRRKDLKLIITSATIDTEKFSAAFDDAPVIEVSGRMYPVEVRHAPDEGAEDRTHVETAVRAAETLCRKSPFGDILIFMPTERDIRETRDLLEARKLKGARIMPLFARLSSGEQARVFSRVAGRKIIVSTNVAETSLTIPGIKYVIDSGLARTPRYTPRTRTTSLPVSPIAKSSADQRKGRCGRVENGVCIRLYTEEDYLSRPRFTSPEILRSNLAEVILRMISLDLGDVSRFPFIDKPDAKSIRDGFALLTELGAVAPRSTKRGGRRYTLTRVGRLMARLPIDPRLSRMLIEARKEGCLKEVTVLAAALSIQDPRERPVEKAGAADQAHARFRDPASDFITLLNIWNRYLKARKELKSFNKVKKFCKARFLSFMRMREWRDVHDQIKAILDEHGFSNKGREGGKKADAGNDGERFGAAYTGIHKSILSGFLSNIAVRKEKNIFNAARNHEVMIFPGSGLFNRAGSWIVAAEMVETSRPFARTAANIDMNWLEKLGGDLCRRVYLNPHWERSRGEVVALEQVSLFGLIIVADRKTSYGKVDPVEATAIFIRGALVDGDVKHPFPFMKHNRAHIEEVRTMEDKIRRRDILVSDEDLEDFYGRRLEECFNLKSLAAIIKKKGGDGFLRLGKKDLLRYAPDREELALFPDRVDLGGARFECDYAFDPGAADDGLTVKIPSSLAPMAPAETMDWLVPGLLKEKIFAMIKGLPKKYRRRLVPVGETVEKITAEMPRTDEALVTALGRFIHRRFGVDIPGRAWPEEALPDHLRMRISITDPSGKEICASRDKAILRRETRENAASADFEREKKKWERTGIVRWDFGDLPDVVRIGGGGAPAWALHPGLERSDGPGVNLRLFRDRGRAMESHRAGVAALYATHFARDLKFLRKRLVLPDGIKGAARNFGGVKAIREGLHERVLRDLFHRNIRTEKEFISHAETAGPSILGSGDALLSRTVEVLNAWQETLTVIGGLETSNRMNAGVLEFLHDIREELNGLAPETFLEIYDADRLLHLPRYIRASGVRARRALVDFDKDRAKAERVRPFTDGLNRMIEGLSPSATEARAEAVQDFFWLIQEFKVSVFAQELKTAMPVSEKRLRNRQKEIERMA